MADQDYLSYSSVYTSFSKGPKSVYNGIGDEMLPGFIFNVPQMDDDDEWGRTARIADERGADFIARIYKTLFNPYNVPLTDRLGNPIVLNPGEAGSDIVVADNMIRLIGRSGINSGYFDLTVPNLTLGDIVIDGSINTITIGVDGLSITPDAVTIPTAAIPFVINTLGDTDGLLTFGRTLIALVDDGAAVTSVGIGVKDNYYYLGDDMADFGPAILKIGGYVGNYLTLTTDSLFSSGSEADLTYGRSNIRIWDDGISSQITLMVGDSYINHLFGETSAAFGVNNLYLGSGSSLIISLDDPILVPSPGSEVVFNYNRSTFFMYDDGVDGVGIGFSVDGELYWFSPTEMWIPSAVSLFLTNITAEGDITILYDVNKLIVGSSGGELSYDTLKLVSPGGALCTLTANSPFSPGEESVLSYGKSTLFLYDINPSVCGAYASAGFLIEGTLYEFGKSGVSFGGMPVADITDLYATNIILTSDLSADIGNFTTRVSSDYFNGYNFGSPSHTVIVCGDPYIRLQVTDSGDYVSITLEPFALRPGNSGEVSLGTGTKAFTEVWLEDEAVSTPRRIYVCANKLYLDGSVIGP